MVWYVSIRRVAHLQNMSHVQSEGTVYNERPDKVVRSVPFVDFKLHQITCCLFRGRVADPELRASPQSMRL